MASKSIVGYNFGIWGVFYLGLVDFWH